MNKYTQFLTQCRIKRELRKMKREQKRCAKQYPDYVNNEYNMLDCKFIWGLTEDPKAAPASFYTYNKAQVYYNRRTKKYYMDIDTSFFQQTTKESIHHLIKYIQEIIAVFDQWMFNQYSDSIVPQISIEEWFEEPLLEAANLEQLWQKVLVFSQYINLQNEKP